MADLATISTKNKFQQKLKALSDKAYLDSDSDGITSGLNLIMSRAHLKNG